jgi:ABC-type antimicrobial peptide transport system permease subunit
MRLVFAGGLRVAAIGGCAGVVVALLSGRFVERLLFQTSPRDPVIFTSAFGVVLLVAVIAAFLPARRALSVDPIVALKAD